MADAAGPEATVEWVPTDTLYLDPLNPRLAEMGQGVHASQEAIAKALWKFMAVDELALSIAASGFFPLEPLMVASEGDRAVVVEGNRRLLAVKLLVDPGLRSSLGVSALPEVTPQRRDQLRSLPIVRVDRREVWNYLGFKHVNGPQPWDSLSKAEYIARVHLEYGKPLDDIAQTIGDRHSTVKRLFRGLMVLRQSEREGRFDKNDRWSKRFAFSHLYTGLDKRGFQSFLGLEPDGGFQPNPVPADQAGNLGDLLLWLYGSRKANKRPRIQSQNPDLADLDETLLSRNGLAALRQDLPLDVCLSITRGDPRLFREAMVMARQQLENARAKLLTGYRGEPDLMDTADAVQRLAKRIYEEMSEIRGSACSPVERRRDLDR